MMVRSYPQSYEEASHDPRWRTIMQEEFKSSQENETWELVRLPSKRKLVQCKWLYRNNIDSDSSYVKYNSSFFSKGLSQFHGVDYIDTFAPIAKMDSMRLVLAIVASK